MATGREAVTWNVVAAPEFSLEPKRWCFPFAGCVPYRGYFDPAGADRLAGRLADQGFDVHLVEKQPELGGNFRHERTSLNGDDPQQVLDETVDRTTTHPRITVHLGSSLSLVEGSVGNFTSTIARNGTELAQGAGVHGAVCLRLERVQYACPAGHGTGMPVLKLPSGDQDHRELVVRRLVRGNQICRREARPTFSPWEAITKDNGLARVF